MYRSFTHDEIARALAQGGRAWRLDTDNAGEDDTLLGDDEASVWADVLAHHDLDAIPAGWTLTVIEGGDDA